MKTDCCEVNAAGLVFKVFFEHYEGCKQTELTPAESESIEIYDVDVWDKKKRKYVPAYDFIDSLDEFQEVVEEQIWDYLSE